MRISKLTPNYNTAQTQIKTNTQTFTQRNKNNSTDSYERALRISAGAMLACLAIAYGGGKIILKQHEERMNEILDKYEQELREIHKSYEMPEAESLTDSITFETDTIK